MYVIADHELVQQYRSLIKLEQSIFHQWNKKILTTLYVPPESGPLSPSSRWFSKVKNVLDKREEHIDFLDYVIQACHISFEGDPKSFVNWDNVDYFVKKAYNKLAF